MFGSANTAGVTGSCWTQAKAGQASSTTTPASAAAGDGR